MKYLVIVLAMSFSQIGLAAEVLIATGEVFDKEGKNKKFTYEKYQSVDGDKVLNRAIFKDLSGKVLTEEKVIRINDKLVRYDIEQKQTKQKGWIEVADGKVTFNFKKYRKRNYSITTELPKNFIIGLQIVPTIVENWDLFVGGKEMEIKLGVWHRQEAITFDLKMDKSSDKELIIKMSPTSFIIRAVVDPIYFTLDKKTKSLTSYKGRTTPKEQRGRSYYDFDGITYYKKVTSESGKTKSKNK